MNCEGSFSRSASAGLTAVMVTHDMTEALLAADLIAVMNAAGCSRLGSPQIY